MYTEEQIKAAFWKTFHKAGELWFSNRGGTPESEAECDTAVANEYAEFLEHLKAGPNV